MSKLISLFKKAPKLTTALIAIIASAIIVPAALLAWGPERPTFTIEHPANHVTFDSITNNPNYGDERNFVTIKDTANTSAGGWVDDINVVNGKEYYVRAYVHNNAADNLKLVANNVTAQFNVPTQTANRIQIDGYISATNASPAKIWDQAVFSGSNDFNLTYVPGSATYTNNVHTGGITLPDSVVGSGAKLGYQTMDGNIPGCYQYSGYVIFKVKATTPDFSLEKTVRVNNATDKTFKENVTVNPGDKVDYQIYFKNTGGTQLKDVVIKDTLPTGITYVPGSTYLHNSDGTKSVADGVTAGGIIIGGYMPDGDAYVKFTAVVAANGSLPVCGLNKLVNTAKATTGSGSKEDTAEVDVTKECQPEKPVYSCDSLTATFVSDTEYSFTGKATAKNGATIKDYKFDFGDSSNKTVTNPTDVAHTYADKGATYTAKLYVKINVDNTEKTVTSDACTVKITVGEKPPVTPPELPQTGAGENIAAFLGIGALVTSFGYYQASRRKV